MKEQSPNNRVKELEKELDSFLAREKLFIESQKIAKIGSWNLDLLTPELEWSKQTYHLFDKDLNDVISFDIFAKLVHPEDSELMHRSFNAALQSDDYPYHVIVRIVNESGREWYMEAFGAVSRNENGEPIRIAGTAQDVTERKWTDELKSKNIELIKAKEKAEENEKHLKTNQNFLNRIIDQSPFATWISDEKGTIIRCNAALTKLLKISEEQLVGKYNVFEDEVAKKEGLIPKIRSVFENGNTENFLVEWDPNKLGYKDSKKVLIEGTMFPVHDEKGNLTNVVNHWIDVTARKKAEEKLKISELRYRNLFNQANEGLLIMTIEGELHDLNTAFSEMHGYTVDELKATNIKDLDVLGDKTLEDRNDQIELILKGEVVRFDVNHNHKKGYVFPLSVTVSLITIGNEQFFMAFHQDITERKLVEEELQKSKEKAEESDRLKSAFLANMSHEIRTPMNAILGFSSLLKKENLSEDKKEKYLDLIDSGGNRLLTLISDIVDVSKIDSNQLSINYETCNVNELINNIQDQFNINDINKACEIKTKKGLDNAKSIISIDETRLSQILFNLLENAIKFTDTGHIEFGYIKKDKMLEFFVTDDGIGIDEKYHTSIFDRFIQVDNDYSKSGSGTGLGLSIVKSLVELLGGKVWVDSEKGKGATFYFTIPYKLAKHKIDKVINVPIELEKDEEISILIVEDEYSNYMYLEALLEDYKYNIIHAKNGKEAVEIVNKNSSIDLVLMDIKMPVMNGLEATKEIRKTKSNVPIIALTAYAMAEDKQKALNAGCNDYLSKPLSENKLAEILKKYTRKGANRIDGLANS